MKIWGIGQISNEEKNDILSKHRELYNGYQTMQPQVDNTRPLFVQDFANDKGGLVVNNKGEVKPYTNMGINEGIFGDMFSKKHKKINTIKHGGHEIDVWSDGDETLYGHPKKEGESTPYVKKHLAYNDLDSLKKAIDSVNKSERGEKTGMKDWQSGDEPMDMAGSAVPSFFPKPTKKIDNPDFKGFAVKENVKEVCDECGAMEMEEHWQDGDPQYTRLDEGECSECGGMMKEGECSECGWKGEVGAMEENKIVVKGICDECGGLMEGGECTECGHRLEELDERTGHLDDIYNVKDLDLKGHFDYVQGDDNYEGSFEKMHKNLYKEQTDLDVLDMETGDKSPFRRSMFDVEDMDTQKYEDPDNEDDGFEDLQVDGGEMYEQGYTGGGNAPDMDLSNIKSAYNFKPKGPEVGDGPYNKKANDMDLDDEDVWEPYDFESGGATSGGDAFPQYESECEECWEKMESAWSDDELEEANDISGVQGIYSDMEPPYDFDSEGPGEAGPYQRSSWNEQDEDEIDINIEDDDQPTEKELANFDPKDKSWSEINAFLGTDELEHLDEELKESVVKQQTKIIEMFNRMKVIK